MKAISSSLHLATFLIVALALAACTHLEDDTTGKSDICEVHHVRMTKRPLSFRHGMIPMSKVEGEKGWWKHRMDHYPHPGDCIPATNIVLPGQESRALSFVCPVCQQAHARALSSGLAPAP
ncbi:hypothetical protein [Prosthecobacter sp.]|uniref:hypothetical protein n=1 Tax=Prosthecobacter sp. TaxID=1965333 RepID=UPI003784ADC3